MHRSIPKNDLVQNKGSARRPHDPVSAKCSSSEPHNAAISRFATPNCRPVQPSLPTVHGPNGRTYRHVVLCLWWFPVGISEVLISEEAYLVHDLGGVDPRRSALDLMGSFVL